MHLGVERHLGQEDVSLCGIDVELPLRQCVVPEQLHVLPVRYNPALDWVTKGENSALGLRLVACVDALLA